MRECVSQPQNGLMIRHASVLFRQFQRLTKCGGGVAQQASTPACPSSCTSYGQLSGQTDFQWGCGRKRLRHGSGFA